MVLDQIFDKVVLQITEDINTPRSLAVYLLYRHRELLQLMSMTVQPTHYTESELYLKDVVATDLLRKLQLDSVKPESVLRQEAFARLMTTELKCEETNVRLSRFRLGGPFQGSDLKLLPVIQEIKVLISNVLGPLNDRVFDSVGFGPGATLTNPGKLSTIPDKLESVPCGTTSALALFNRSFAGSAWTRRGSWGTAEQGLRKTVRGNRFFTVPKTATSLRGACLSPNVNGFLQKGVGTYIKGRLRRVGIDIEGSVRGESRAKLKHRALACAGSRWGTFATIDLSDASNTISSGLVQLLLPEDWYDLLADLREPFMQRPDGRWQKLSMFSAMGNGFTFELETLIFWAISTVAGRGRVETFGDDIVCHSHAAPAIMAALRFFGFSLNTRKTFVSGPFRESCGGDFFDGVPVRAHYVKKLPSAPQDWIALANGIRRVAYGDPHTEHRWSYLRRAWLTCLSALPVAIRGLRGPVELGDLVIHDHEHLWQCRTKNSIRYVKCLAGSADPLPWVHWPSHVVLSAALYGCDTDGPIPRGAQRHYRVKLVPFS